MQRKLQQKFFLVDAINSKETSQEYKSLVMSHERVFDKKFGDFYGGLKTQSRMAMNYNYIFILRRFLFVFTAYYWYGQVAIQIGFFTLTT
jgi:hypothetical protein